MVEGQHRLGDSNHEVLGVLEKGRELLEEAVPVLPHEPRPLRVISLDQLVFLKGLDLSQKSPDYGEIQYDARKCKQRFAPALRVAGGSKAGPSPRTTAAARGRPASNQTYLRLIDSCITQLKAQGPSRTTTSQKCAAVSRRARI